MYTLSRPHTAVVVPLLDGTPAWLLGGTALTAIAAWVLATVGALPASSARAIAAGAAQGALLATAVAWTVARTDPGRNVLPSGIALTALLGAVAASVAPVGAAAYALTPLWLWRRRARFRALGVDGPPPTRLVLAGAGLGALLGVHLAITASLTFGYRVGWVPDVAVVPWLAYYLGANVLAAECFFRGALFDRAQRRWSFAAAAALSTAACLARYLVDPLLPRTLEVAAGAAFYLALLSVGNCWLYWRSGSVIPGLAAGFVFFAVYRLLHVVR